MSYSTEQIRNVALAGHPGAGKTILFEALLHAGGAVTSGRHHRTRHDRVRFRSDRKGPRAFDRRGDRQHRPRRHPREPHRHARLSRFPRADAVGAGRGGNGGDRGRRRHRHRLRHAPDDGLREGAQPVPRHRRQQDRPSRRKARRAARQPAQDLRARSACRSTCRPKAASACRTVSGNPRATSDLGPGRRLAPENHRPGRRDQRDGDGPLPGRRRGRPVRARNCTTPSSSACAKATWCRCASSPRAAAPA